jgi:hypothetical protein
MRCFNFELLILKLPFNCDFAPAIACSKQAASCIACDSCLYRLFLSFQVWSFELWHRKCRPNKTEKWLWMRGRGASPLSTKQTPEELSTRSLVIRDCKTVTARKLQKPKMSAAWVVCVLLVPCIAAVPPVGGSRGGADLATSPARYFWRAITYIA